LNQSKLWVDTTSFGHIHRHLKGATVSTKADKTAIVNTAKGQVRQCKIHLSDSRSKLFMWGPLLGITSLQKPDVLWL